MMQIGVTIPNDVLTDEGDGVRSLLVACREIGYDYVVTLDHVLGADVTTRPGWTGHYDAANAFHEPLTFLAYAAGVAPGLGLATGVMVLPQRQTALVAKQVAQLDVMSGGRMRLGVGVGWNDVEYVALGVDFETRARRYEEQVSLLRELWTSPVVDFDGDFHRVDRAGINPLPMQRPVPIWMGGGTSARVLERIGRLGDGWIVMGGVQVPGEETRSALASVHEAARSAGRDPALLGLEGRVPLAGALDQPDTLRRVAAGWRALGVTHLSLHGLPPRRSAEEYVDIVQRAHRLLAA